MRCPKCHYQRKLSDSSPAWQCPSCGIVYDKFAQIKVTNREEQQRWIEQGRDNIMRSKRLWRIEITLAILGVVFLLGNLFFREANSGRFWAILFGVGILILTINIIRLGMAPYHPYGYLSRDKHPILFKLQVACGVGLSVFLLYISFA